ncbi:MAG: RNA pseudouridine synthase, partial [Clostridia bacterium]|nr:RNA pseudouridine synthase [Clostridia bacterium]
MQCSIKHTLITDEKSAGKRADIFITEELDELTRSYLRTLIEKGCVKRNGNIIKKCGECVNLGDVIDIEIPPIVTLSAEPENLPLDIIYEDDDLIIINKAQGMVTHPATGTPSGTLVNALMYRAERLSTINGIIRPGIVHRLDKNTSGLLVVAKNDRAHSSLALQIAEKT